MNIGMMNAISGLLASQRAIDVTGHNLANADTPGYSRQRMDQSTNDPQGSVGLWSRWAGKGMIGTGTQITQIKRITDNFIHNQILRETHPLGETQVAVDTLRQVEDILGDPSERGLSKAVTRFFDAWQELTTNPESYPLRINMREAAAAMSSAFNETHKNLSTLRDDLNGRVMATVDDINSITGQIADLNRQIKKGVAAGQNPNDLMDRRDLLLEQLSMQVRTHTVDTGNGAVNVYINGAPLVFDEHAMPMITYYPQNPPPPPPPAVFYQPPAYVQVAVSPTNPPPPSFVPTPAPISGGALKGLLDMRDKTLSDDPALAQPGFMRQLNLLADEIRTQVNNVHQAGFGLTGNTGIAFFYDPVAPPFYNPDMAALELQVNPLFDTNLEDIAAAGQDPTGPAGGVGDNAASLAIAQLRAFKFMGGGTFTFDDFYKGVVTQAGTMGQEANRALTNQEALLSSVKERRDAVSGVSTDEEMANVIKFQKAYAANAKMLSTIDEMLDTLINIGR